MGFCLLVRVKVVVSSNYAEIIVIRYASEMTAGISRCDAVPAHGQSCVIDLTQCNVMKFDI